MPLKWGRANQVVFEGSKKSMHVQDDVKAKAGSVSAAGKSFFQRGDLFFATLLHSLGSLHDKFMLMGVPVLCDEGR